MLEHLGILGINRQQCLKVSRIESLKLSLHHGGWIVGWCHNWTETARAGQAGKRKKKPHYFDPGRASMGAGGGVGRKACVSFRAKRFPSSRTPASLK